jgi:hypothetical protein
MPPPLIPQPVSTAPAAPGFVEDEENDNIFGAPAAGVPAYAQGNAYPAPGVVPGYHAPVPAADPWGAPGAATPAKPRPKRVVKQQGISPTLFAVTAVVSIVLVIIGGVWIYNNYRKADEASRPPEAAKQPAEEQKRPNSIFDFQPAKGAKTGAADTTKAAPVATATPDRRVAPRAAPKTQPAPAPSAAATQAKPEMEPAAEKAIDDPEWDAVERARSGGDPVIAIVKYQDFLDRFPENKNKKDIERYPDDALDLLRWKRLNDLFAERNEAQKQIASRKMEISQAQDPNFKKDLEKEIARFTETRDNVDSVIHDQMMFTGETPPNLYDSQDLAIARKSRDAKYYEETWKPQVLKTIKASHGQRLPWRNSQ